MYCIVFYPVYLLCKLAVPIRTGAVYKDMMPGPLKNVKM